MRRRNTQESLFPATSRPALLSGAGFGLISGGFLGVLGVILNPDLGLWTLAGIVVAALALGFFRPTRRALAGVTAVLAAGLLLCLFTPVLRPLEAALDVTEAPARADVIVALGGGMRCGAGQLEGASLARVVRALELWRQGYAATITLSDTSGLWPDCPGLAAVANRTLERLLPGSPGQGRPEVVTLADVHSTRDEARAVAEAAQKRNWKRVMIVTSPSHSRRARATFQQLKLDAFVVAAPEPRFDTELRLPFDRLMALPALAREVAGLVKYSLFGWF